MHIAIFNLLFMPLIQEAYKAVKCENCSYSDSCAGQCNSLEIIDFLNELHVKLADSEYHKLLTIEEIFKLFTPLLIIFQFSKGIILF